MEKKKKVDRVALSSSFMRIPHMSVELARYLLDLGFTENYQLSGRSPETIFNDIQKNNFAVSEQILPMLRLAVYFAETEHPDKALLNLHKWEF